MTKLNYGPRFAGGSVAGGKVSYDERMDADMRKINAMFKGLSQRPLYKRELSLSKAKATGAKRRAKTAVGPEREEAEMRMAEAVRKCVEILEFHMDDLIQHHKVQSRPSYCMQQHIHNVIVELRNRCGVMFEERNPQYAERACENQRRRDGHDIAEENRSEREQQRLSRMRNMREMAERLAEMHNRGKT